MDELVNIIFSPVISLVYSIQKLLKSTDFYPRGASDARVIAIIVCVSVCLCVCVCVSHTPVLYQNG